MDLKVYLRAGWDLKQKTRGMFATDRLIVGQVLLSKAGLTVEKLIDSVRSGTVKIGKHQLKFQLDGAGRATPHFNEFEANLNNVHRMALLSMRGLQRSYGVSKSTLDWHLKAHAYDSLDELCIEFGLSPAQFSGSHLQIISGTVVEAFMGAEVKGGWAHPSIISPSKAERSKLSLAYRVFDAGKVTNRVSVAADKLTWKKAGSNWIGSTKAKVKPGAAIQCFAAYGGHAQHHAWIGDMTSSPNLRHTICKELDPELQVVSDYLFDDRKGRREPREFELAVAWLLWMSGFSVLHVATKRLEDNVDVVAVTPANKILLIECTLGLLSREGKTSNLLQRTAAMRKRLDQSGFAHLPLIPVGITAKPKDELTAEIAEAGKSGVM